MGPGRGEGRSTVLDRLYRRTYTSKMVTAHPGAHAGPTSTPSDPTPVDLEACEKLLVVTGTTHPGSFLRSGHTAYGPSASSDALVARLAAISRPL